MKTSATYRSVRGTAQMVSNIAQAMWKARFTEQDAQNPKSIADAITRLQTALEEATRPLRTSPLAQCQLFEDVACSSGVNVSLQHSLGRRVYWVSVDATTNAPGFTRSSDTTTDVLVLTPTATGTVSLLVF